MLDTCPTCHRPAGINDGDNGMPPVDLSRCACADGWECRAVAQATRTLRAQVLEYAETLAATRRESADRLSRIQVLTAIVPSAADLDAIDDAVGAAYYGQRTIDSTTYLRAVEWLTMAEEAVKHLPDGPSCPRPEPERDGEEAAYGPGLDLRIIESEPVDGLRAEDGDRG